MESAFILGRVLYTQPFAMRVKILRPFNPVGYSFILCLQFDSSEITRRVAINKTSQAVFKPISLFLAFMRMW
eukprot:scaffold18897_cov18-Prasinocladus_malaysianus.AAC.1